MIQDKTPSFRLYLHFIFTKTHEAFKQQKSRKFIFCFKHEWRTCSKTQLAAQIHQRDKQTGTNKLRKTDCGCRYTTYVTGYKKGIREEMRHSGVNTASLCHLQGHLNRQIVTFFYCPWEPDNYNITNKGWLKRLRISAGFLEWKCVCLNSHFTFSIFRVSKSSRFVLFE